jgi:hypothetical protein
MDEIKEDIRMVTSNVASSMTSMQKNAFVKFFMFPNCFEFVRNDQFVVAVKLWYELCLMILGVDDSDVDKADGDVYKKLQRIKKYIHLNISK